MFICFFKFRYYYNVKNYVNEAAAEYGVALARAAGSCSGDEDLKAILEVPRLRRQASGLGFRASGLGFEDSLFGFRASGLGLRVGGFGFGSLIVPFFVIVIV